MAIKPTKPTSPPQALRSNPENFSANAEGWIAYQATTFPNYIDAITDFVDEKADEALAAAIGGDLPPLTGQAGKVLAVKGDESGAEFVDLPPDTIGALTTNGLVARTGAGTAAARTLTAGTGIVVTNGDGVAGNPTVAASIATQAEAEAGTDNAKLMTPLRVAQAVADSLNAPGSAPTYACRAWVNFNGTGTVAIRASGNVSSVTDNGVGDYTVNFTTAMPDANYSVVATCSPQYGADRGGICSIASSATPSEVAPTTSAIRVITSNSSAVSADFKYVNVAVFR
jgi:hypothetical protein